MKKKILSGIIALTTLFSLNACGADDSSSDELNTARVINVAVQPGTSEFVLNDSKQMIEEEFKDSGVEIAYYNFSGGPAIIEAMTAGDVDFAITGDLPVLSAIANGADIEAVYLGPLDKEEMQVFVKPESNISTVEDLIGKSVGLPVGSAGHNFLAQILSEAGYSIGDVTIVNLSSDDIATALDKGEIDAGVIQEPQATIIANSVGAQIIITSDGYFEPLKLLDARKSFAESNPELTAKFIKAIAELDQYTIKNSDEVVKLLADSNGNSTEDWACVTRYEYRGAFSDSALTAAENSIRFLVDNGMITKSFDVSLVYDDQYYSRAEELMNGSEG